MGCTTSNSKIYTELSDKDGRIVLTASNGSAMTLDKAGSGVVTSRGSSKNDMEKNENNPDIQSKTKARRHSIGNPVNIATAVITTFPLLIGASSKPPSAQNSAKPQPVQPTPKQRRNSTNSIQPTTPLPAELGAASPPARFHRLDSFSGQQEPAVENAKGYWSSFVNVSFKGSFSGKFNNGEWRNGLFCL